MPDSISAYAKGVMGETAAARFLEASGMQVLERRFRSPVGEIDLILLEGKTLVFAEVKARERQSCAQAQYAVTPAKQRRLVQTACWYLGQHPEHQQRLMRFDVVIIAQDGIAHIPNAFEGSM